MPAIDSVSIVNDALLVLQKTIEYNQEAMDEDIMNKLNNFKDDLRASIVSLPDTRNAIFDKDLRELTGEVEFNPVD